jgi:hypothetical protein
MNADVLSAFIRVNLRLHLSHLPQHADNPSKPLKEAGARLA